MDILLDSGSTISLVQNSVLTRASGVKQLKPGDLQLVFAAGEHMPVVGQANVVVQIQQLSMEHWCASCIGCGSLTNYPSDPWYGFSAAA